MTRRPRRDYATLGAGVLMLLLVALGVYVAAWAPCDAIDWLPTRELPGRCLR